MHTVVGNLLDRAERAGAALTVFDEQDRVVITNRRLVQIYEFVDFAKRPTFGDIVHQCVGHGKLDNPVANRDPEQWIRQSLDFFRSMDYFQYVIRHSDGKVMLVYYEKMGGIEGWWYQVRLDITGEIRTRPQVEPPLLGPESWQSVLSPLSVNSYVPTGNALELVPAATALIGVRGQILDANSAFRRILQRADGLFDHGGRLELREYGQRGEFRQRLERFFGSPPGRLPVAMRVIRNDAGRSYLATVTELFTSAKLLWNSEADAALVTVADPSALPAVNPRLLSDFYGLTEAEAAVACLLGVGLSVKQIAARRGSETTTVHSQINGIKNKTGFSGVAEIARQVGVMGCMFANVR